jgi:molybdopterin converting factor small subunit
MPRVTLTAHLSTQAGGTSFQVNGATIREILTSLFQLKPQLKSYLLEDYGALRHHVVAFVNGEVVRDKSNLNQAVPEDGELFLLQALSGG